MIKDATLQLTNEEDASMTALKNFYCKKNKRPIKIIPFLKPEPDYPLGPQAPGLGHRNKKGLTKPLKSFFVLILQNYKENAFLFLNFIMFSNCSSF